jgi:hypothetical protein
MRGHDTVDRSRGVRCLCCVRSGVRHIPLPRRREVYVVALLPVKHTGVCSAASAFGHGPRISMS